MISCYSAKKTVHSICICTENGSYSIVATGVKGDSSKVKFELFQQHGGDDIIYNTADCVNG